MKSDVETKLFHVSLVISEISFKMSDESQQTKSNCLSAVGTILSQIENLVKSKLSSINDDVCDQSSSVGDDPDSSSSVNDDVCISSCDKLLWWDNYNYYDSYYHLYYNSDEDGHIASSDDEEEVPTCREECVTDDPTCCEERVIDDPTGREECVIDSSKLELMPSISASSMDMMMKVLTAMTSLAPSSIYDRKKAMRKRKRRMKKTICPELFSIWKFAATIFSPRDANSEQSITPTYPTVDWKSVNRRFLTNLPTPSPLPIHGCSPNPDDYKDVFCKSDFGGMQNIGAKFDREFPFGNVLGFMTSNGAVGIPNDVIHGHVYQVGQGWVLHSSFPEVIQKKKTKMMRRKMKKEG